MKKSREDKSGDIEVYSTAPFLPLNLPGNVSIRDCRNVMCRNREELSLEEIPDFHDNLGRFQSALGSRVLREICKFHDGKTRKMFDYVLSKIPLLMIGLLRCSGNYVN